MSQLLQLLSTIRRVVLSEVARQVLLLAYFLPLDPMLGVESPERGWGDALIGKLPVEEYTPLLDAMACP